MGLSLDNIISEIDKSSAIPLSSNIIGVSSLGVVGSGPGSGVGSGSGSGAGGSSGSNIIVPRSIASPCQIMVLFALHVPLVKKRYSSSPIDALTTVISISKLELTYLEL